MYVEETERVQEYDCIPLIGEAGKGTAGIFRDMIVPREAETLWRYDDPFYQQYAAVTRNPFGKGMVYYLGTTPDPEILKSILYQAMDQAGMEPMELPQGVESVIRGKGKEKIRILMNHNDYPACALGEKLEPFQVKVLSVF